MSNPWGEWHTQNQHGRDCPIGHWCGWTLWPLVREKNPIWKNMEKQSQRGGIEWDWLVSLDIVVLQCPLIVQKSVWHLFQVKRKLIFQRFRMFQVFIHAFPGKILWWPSWMLTKLLVSHGFLDRFSLTGRIVMASGHVSPKYRVYKLQRSRLAIDLL